MLRRKKDPLQSELDTAEGPTAWVDSFPVVPTEYRPRELIFRQCLDTERKILEEKGYAVVNLITLPRGNVNDQIVWIKNLLQGVTDGTISFSREESDALKLEMQMRGLLKGEIPVDNKEIGEHSSIDDLLNWSDSAHQLEGTTTTVNVEDVINLKRKMQQATKSAEKKTPRRDRKKKGS
jgi:hypothetical protein